MIKISICDDNSRDLHHIAENLRTYSSLHTEYGIEFNTFSSAFEMLDSFAKTGSPDIALLDVCMPGMLGTELARDILRCSENTDIIFLTTSADYAVDAFSIHAADYIQKPYTQEKFNDSLDRVISMRQDRTWLLLSCNGELHRIALEEILYIETIGKNRVFFLASGKKLPVRMTSAQLQETISGGEGMVFCGASFVVNLRHVRCFSGADLVIDNGALIPIPRRVRSQLKQEFFNFYLKEAKNRC